MLRQSLETKSRVVIALTLSQGRAFFGIVNKVGPLPVLLEVVRFLIPR